MSRTPTTLAVVGTCAKDVFQSQWNAVFDTPPDELLEYAGRRVEVDDLLNGIPLYMARHQLPEQTVSRDGRDASSTIELILGLLVRPNQMRKLHNAVLARQMRDRFIAGFQSPPPGPPLFTIGSRDQVIEAVSKVFPWDLFAELIERLASNYHDQSFPLLQLTGIVDRLLADAALYDFSRPHQPLPYDPLRLDLLLALVAPEHAERLRQEYSGFQYIEH